MGAVRKEGAWCGRRLTEIKPKKPSLLALRVDEMMRKGWGIKVFGDNTIYHPNQAR